ncbi:PEP-CTERM sorting domain-containing protein [Nitrosospira lacus]|uniref:carbonic anhydrase n=1 Tax=Nitrosospira lacus TaxID=1288494 RepID=A0A1W6SMQ7_9PROT|nr:carbonic anhydrase family protein [Nitrosospira lacus]ARO87062.1 PEP-CTERM sorting domain-containing protein [Nitrosospira lacus]
MKTSFYFKLSQSAILASVILFHTFSAAQADTLADNLAAMEAQSPINITTNNTTFEKNLSPLLFTLNSDTQLKVINNGSPLVDKTAARANVVDPGAGSVTVGGDTYRLSQFHFHTPAEHLENGYKFPMEMHMVFADAKANLLVVGRWVEEGAFNAALDPIFSHLPHSVTDTLTVNHFNLNALIPDNLNSFRYDGSLTTPPFSEGVKWIDLAQPLDMSAEQINAFSSLFPNGDAREIQPLNGRTIFTDVPGFATVAVVPEPETYSMLLAGLVLIGFVAKRRLANRGFMGSIA